VADISTKTNKFGRMTATENTLMLIEILSDHVV